VAAAFDFHERLGAGHFGEVWRVTDTGLGVVRALKVIAPAKVLNPTNYFHEAQMLKAAEHPNVVKVEETGKFADGRIYVAMEYLPKGSLEDEAKGTYVPLRRAQRIMIDVLRGLEHAHGRGVLHRDIKPANIMIGTHSEGKVSDFGLAIPVGMSVKALGVKEYKYILHSAPEVLEGKPHSIASDIYACGMTMYRMVNGDTYFNPPSPLDLHDHVKHGLFPDRNQYRDWIPLALRKVINKAIDPDSAKRYTSAREMRAALERITIEKDWKEKILPNGVQWICGWDNKCYEVSLEEVNGVWSVTVRKGASKNKLRRVNKLCSDGLKLDTAKSKARRILMDFVLGKHQ